MEYFSKQKTDRICFEYILDYSVHRVFVWQTKSGVYMSVSHCKAWWRRCDDMGIWDTFGDLF